MRPIPKAYLLAIFTLITSGYLENLGGIQWSCNGLYGSVTNPIYCQVLHNIKGLARKVVEKGWVFLIGELYNLARKTPLIEKNCIK